MRKILDRAKNEILVEINYSENNWSVLVEMRPLGTWIASRNFWSFSSIVVFGIQRFAGYTNIHQLIKLLSTVHKAPINFLSLACSQSCNFFRVFRPPRPK